LQLGIGGYGNRNAAVGDHAQVFKWRDSNVTRARCKRGLVMHHHCAPDILIDTPQRRLPEGYSSPTSRTSSAMSVRSGSQACALPQESVQVRKIPWESQALRRFFK
jgi:hypothetical protein